MGDGAEVVNNFLARHADSGVGDGDGAGVFIDRDVDFQFCLGVQHVLVGEHFEAQPVEGVGGVREQFAQEDFAVFVKGVDEDVKELFGFGFEGEGFGHDHLVWVGNVG